MAIPQKASNIDITTAKFIFSLKKVAIIKATIMGCTNKSVEAIPAGMKVKETKSVMEEVTKTTPKTARYNNSLRLTLKEIFLQRRTIANIAVAKKNR